jgi:Cu/Ag efflux pump CusA
MNRVRPRLINGLAVMIGLGPALWGHGAGANAIKHIAAPMVGGW